MFSKLTGRYDRSLDSKGRLQIPAAYRPLFPDGEVFVTQGFDTNLMVMTPEVFETFSEQLSETSLTDPDARQLMRLLYSYATQLKIDDSGRINVPTFLLEVAKIEWPSNVMVIGMGRMFEVWSQEAWVMQDTILQDASFKHKGYSEFTIKAT